MPELRVKGLWWEGSRLKVVTEDEKLLTFTNCYPIASSEDGVAFDERTGLGEIQIKFTFDLKSQQ
jgi:hypothetical protein